MNYPAHNNKEAVWKEVPVNSQALSLFRILFAALLIFDLVVYVLPHWEFLYGAGGAYIASERDTDLAWSILREQIATTSQRSPRCIAGMTFSVPIFAVLKMPQRILLIVEFLLTVSCRFQGVTIRYSEPITVSFRHDDVQSRTNSRDGVEIWKRSS